MAMPLSNLETVESQSNQDRKEMAVDMNEMTEENEDNVNCKNCGWIGCRNSLLKHLRMMAICRTKYDMQSVYDEQNVLKKIRKQQYNKMQYAKTQEKKRQYYQEKKERPINIKI